MKRIGVILTGLLVIVSFPGAAQVKDFDIETTEKLGRLIYQQEVIAAQATELLFAQGLDLSQYPLRGWVVEETERESIVTFIGEYDDQFRAVFEVRKRGKKKPTFTKLETKELSTYQASAFAARSLALQNIKEPCSDRYNTVVLQEPDGDRFLVYALAATTDPDAILVGGHYRFTISKDGKTVENAERLSSSCLTLDKTPDDMPPGATLAAYSMSHIVSERPLEIHIFLNLLHQVDLHVGTPENGVWLIHDGTMKSAR